MGFLTNGLSYILPFLVVLTVLVFVHELGHYLVARWNKVRVEVFSIGFGKELIGWTDRVGTRWKIGVLPFGGYVRMYGESGLMASGPDAPAEMHLSEREVSFQHKHLLQRAAVVSAGPIANFLFAIVIFTVVFMTIGQSVTLPVVGEVKDGTAAQEAGFKPGDRFVTADGVKIDRFEQLQGVIELNTGTPIDIVVERDGQNVAVPVTPRITEETDRFGNVHRVARLGITAKAGDFVRLGPGPAFVSAIEHTWNISVGTLRALGQMIAGRRSTDDLSGPVGIVRMSGEVAQGGVEWLLPFMGLLSVSLGLINLFPIPVLDGGHLLFYLAEAIRGKPLGQRAQEYGFRLGLALVLTIMVFATFKDLGRWGVFDFFRRLVT